MTPTATAWYRIENKAGEPASLYLFDEISSLWGVGAQDVVDQLKEIDSKQLNVHINSPGGNVWDGLAIMNALRDHPAKVSVIVDGLAASIASVIAMAGDEIVMNRGAQMMVHNPSGVAMGDAKTMRELADTLDKSASSIASVYAARAGGTEADWQNAMNAETWYTAQEAVDAGLADRVDAKQAEDIAAKFDLSIFNHAGRSQAPDPYMPVRPNSPVSAAQAAARIHNAPVRGAQPQGEGEMQFSDEQLNTLRTRLGLNTDAQLTADQIVAALSTPEPEPPQEPDPNPEPPATKKVAGTMVIDASAWDAQQQAIKALQVKQAKRDREDRDEIIAQAVKDGKFAPARKDHWAKLWDADPEGTRATIDGLAKNVIPVEAKGFGVEDEDDFNIEFASLFPKGV